MILSCHSPLLVDLEPTAASAQSVIDGQSLLRGRGRVPRDCLIDLGILPPCTTNRRPNRRLECRMAARRRRAERPKFLWVVQGGSALDPGRSSASVAV